MEKEREHERKKLSFSGSLSKWPEDPDLIQVKTGSLERHAGLPPGYKGLRTC